MKIFIEAFDSSRINEWAKPSGESEIERRVCVCEGEREKKWIKNPSISLTITPINPPDERGPKNAWVDFPLVVCLSVCGSQQTQYDISAKLVKTWGSVLLADNLMKEEWGNKRAVEGREVEGGREGGEGKEGVREGKKERELGSFYNNPFTPFHKTFLYWFLSDFFSGSLEALCVFKGALRHTLTFCVTFL